MGFFIPSWFPLDVALRFGLAFFTSTQNLQCCHTGPASRVIAAVTVLRRVADAGKLLKDLDSSLLVCRTRETGV